MRRWWCSAVSIFILACGLSFFTGAEHYWHAPFSIKHISLYPQQSFVNRSALCAAFGGTCSLLGTCLMYRPVFCNGTSVCCGAPFLFGNFFRHAHDGFGYGYGGYQGGHHRSGGYRGHQGFGPIGGFNLNGHVDTYEHNSHGGYGGWADYGGAHDQAQGFGHIPYNSRYVVWKKKRK